MRKQSKEGRTREADRWAKLMPNRLLITYSKASLLNRRRMRKRPLLLQERPIRQRRIARRRERVETSGEQRLQGVRVL